MIRSSFQTVGVPLLLVLGCLVLVRGTAGIRPVVVGVRGLAPTHVEGGTFPKRLVQPGGLTQALEQPPQRVISLVLGADEILSEILDFARLAGVTRNVDLPAQSNRAGFYPASIPRLAADIETVLALEPDLVVVSGFNREETVRLLASCGVNILRLADGESIAQIIAIIRALGAAVGEEAAAEALVAGMERRLDKVAGQVAGRPRPRVLYYSGGFTAGPGTLLHEIIERAGGENAAVGPGVPGHFNLPIEMAVALKPEVIILPRWSEKSAGLMIRRLEENPVWRKVPAVAHGRVYEMRSARLEAVSHFAVQAVEELVGLLHPEAVP
jgi:iron complex transport system substrate-binding protein